MAESLNTLNDYLLDPGYADSNEATLAWIFGKGKKKKKPDEMYSGGGWPSITIPGVHGPEIKGPSVTLPDVPMPTTPPIGNPNLTATLPPGFDPWAPVGPGFKPMPINIPPFGIGELPPDLGIKVPPLTPMPETGINIPPITGPFNPMPINIPPIGLNNPIDTSQIDLSKFQLPTGGLDLGKLHLAFPTLDLSQFGDKLNLGNYANLPTGGLGFNNGQLTYDPSTGQLIDLGSKLGAGMSSADNPLISGAGQGLSDILGAVGSPIKSAIGAAADPVGTLLGAVGLPDPRLFYETSLIAAPLMESLFGDFMGVAKKNPIEEEAAKLGISQNELISKMAETNQGFGGKMSNEASLAYTAAEIRTAQRAAEQARLHPYVPPPPERVLTKEEALAGVSGDAKTRLEDWYKQKEEGDRQQAEQQKTYDALSASKKAKLDDLEAQMQSAINDEDYAQVDILQAQKDKIMAGG